MQSVCVCMCGSAVHKNLGVYNNIYQQENFGVRYVKILKTTEIIIII